LISRVLDNAPAVKLFEISINSSLSINGKDVFEINNGSQPGYISIAASSTVAAAWGFNYYLKYVANSSGIIYLSIYVVIPFLCIVYWAGKSIRISGSTLMPLIYPIQTFATDLFRWYGNPCTFSYSAVFWNFTR
jgi:hypothetical protein